VIGPEILLPFAAAGATAALLRGDALVAHVRGLCARTRPTSTGTSAVSAEAGQGGPPVLPAAPSTPAVPLCQRCFDGAAVDALVLSVEVGDELVVEVVELCAVCQAALTRPGSSGRAA
jgi:hypothetical protein